MSGNLWMFSDKLDDEDIEMLKAQSTAVSLGGDCDTLTAIAGSIAEGFYGVPEDLKRECRARLDDRLREALDAFLERTAERR